MTARDSLFQERIVWSGQPRALRTPPTMLAFGVVLFVAAIIALGFGLVVAIVLRGSPTGMFLFCLWCATCGLLAIQGPKLWLAKADYLVTDHHVIWRRGRFRRSIERTAISFARITWDPRQPGVGDLEIVRAVPTGALRRRLVLKLSAVSSPDRVWSIIRGEPEVAPLGVGQRPLTQRLDRDERVIWSAQPRPHVRAYLPHGQREWMLLLISAFLVAAALRLIFSGTEALERLSQGGLGVYTWTMATVALALLTTTLLLLSMAAYLAYDTVIRSARLLRQTSYLITNKRVLIQRSHEELHLDRRRIVDVIDTPAAEGVRDLFIVLDGPRARALATSGAFGEAPRGSQLRPVFFAVADAEGAASILRTGA